MRVCVLLAAAALGGCAGAASPPAASPSSPGFDRLTPFKLDASDIAAIQSGMRRGLKDPDSAKFGEIHAGANEKGVVMVCLLVNAKNSYGGYVGMKPQIGLLTTERPRKFVMVPEQGDDPAVRDKTIRQMCDEYGLTLGL